jgi:hypothetical protein
LAPIFEFEDLSGAGRLLSSRIEKESKRTRVNNAHLIGEYNNINESDDHPIVLSMRNIHNQATTRAQCLPTKVSDYQWSPNWSSRSILSSCTRKARSLPFEAPTCARAQSSPIGLLLQRLLIAKPIACLVDSLWCLCISLRFLVSLQYLGVICC